ncbi:MAG TPA: TlpA family protein disulfide reductase [Phycisphaerales bacterium]|nr:TlpA family protein disulfide reductase [Phycisphaerales bacterium]
MKNALCVSAAACLAMAGLAGFGPGDDVVREGAGQRRADLNQMELKPFPGDAWSHLSDWTNGKALTAQELEGKVVVLVTFSSWYKGSHAALASAQKVAEKHGGDVLVVGVHHATGFENAGKVVEEKKVTFAYAKDSGKFREALKVDQDPDVYVIDRAGNLRYADIDTSSLDRAVAALVKETREEAQAVPAQASDQAARQQAEAGRSRPVPESMRPGQPLDVPFTLPDPSAYRGLKWPDHNNEGLSANNVQGQALPQKFGSETWITKQPKTEGRVVVVDFWATWCGPCKRAMPKLDELYKKNKADLVVIGLSDEPGDTVKKFLGSHPHAYPQAVDQKKVLSNSLQVQGIPHVVVMSTDGVVRWQGNPLDPKFGAVVQQIIAIDPGVKARRAAEAEYLKRQQG